MMLSNLPFNNNRPPGPHPEATLPLHVRLFGEHSKWFYIWIITSLAFSLAELVFRPLPRGIADAATLCSPIFLLMVLSPNPYLRAVVFGILCGLVWNETEFESLTTVSVALAAGPIYLIAASIGARIRDRMGSMTRRERRPLVALLTLMELGQAVFILAPASLLAYGYLAGRGAHPVDAQLLIGACAGLWLVLVIRRLWSELPTPTDA
jgi:hypothetical protein